MYVRGCLKESVHECVDRCCCGLFELVPERVDAGAVGLEGKFFCQMDIFLFLMIVFFCG